MPGLKRAHDLEITGYFALALFVPCVQLRPLVMFGFFKRTEGHNRYGPPDPNFAELFK
jgi:uncharacterized membrane protein YhaH (DUF805 family)